MARTQPESILQTDIKKFLEDRNWYVIVMTGSMYQSGVPDLYITHAHHGHRWVEVKRAKSYRFTAAQLKVFPKLCKSGDGVWIMVAATWQEYRKLFSKSNWVQYIKLPR